MMLRHTAKAAAVVTPQRDWFYRRLTGDGRVDACTTHRSPHVGPAANQRGNRSAEWLVDVGDPWTPVLR